jgi:hypothetical protein
MPSSEWAGSPAGSSPIGPRPNAPWPWPSGSAASTRPRPSWARHDLAITAQGLRPLRARHARPQPEAVRQCVVAAASRRGGQPTAPLLDPMFIALNAGQLATQRGPHAEQGCDCAGPRRWRSQWPRSTASRRWLERRGPAGCAGAGGRRRTDRGTARRGQPRQAQLRRSTGSKPVTSARPLSGS